MSECCVAVIGSGAAGLMAAVHAARCGCVLVTDGPLCRSNSMMAQGGMQLPEDDPESLRRFADDIRRSARTTLDRDLLERFVREVPRTVALLVDWGLDLDRDETGAFRRRLAGGLSEPRIVTAADRIGPPVMRVLERRLRETSVDVLDDTRVVDLLPEGRSWVLRLRSRDGHEESLRARAVVCCTGGTAYSEAHRRGERTTNPKNGNHVLSGALARLDLPRVHDGWFQYQPFGIVGDGRKGLGRCVPESVLNFGVKLLDRDGHSILNRMEDRRMLSSRMFTLVREGRAVEAGDGSRGFLLTLGSVPEDALSKMLPGLHRFLVRLGKLGEDLLVFPFLHYQLGGFRIDPHGSTGLPGLFVAGEAAGGLHGRNRLMGNGITDALVHGRVAGISAAAYVGGMRGGLDG